MPAFQYIAMRANGQRSTGTMEASSPNEVATRLKSEELFPIEIRSLLAADQGFRPLEEIISRMPITNTDRIMLLRELAMMTRAGITLPNAVQRLGEAAVKRKIKDCMFGIQEHIQDGMPLSESMLLYPSVFSTEASHIISSAEQTGELSVAFTRIADGIAFWTQIKKKVIESVTYPVIIIIVAIAVAAFMLLSFIPKLQRFLQGAGRELPAFTQFVFDTADFVRGNLYTILGIIAAIIICLIVAWKRPGGRRFLEGVILKVPIFGKIMTFMEMARFCGILGGMVSSGATLTNSLPVLRDTLVFHRYKDFIDELREQLMDGDSLASGMRNSLVPVTAQSVISSGEESGSLPQALKELEDFFSETLQRMLALIMSLVEPILILSVGGFVGSIYLAMFLALLSINGAA